MWKNFIAMWSILVIGEYFSCLDLTVEFLALPTILKNIMYDNTQLLPEIFVWLTRKCIKNVCQIL